MANIYKVCAAWWQEEHRRFLLFVDLTIKLTAWVKTKDWFPPCFESAGLSTVPGTWKNFDELLL